MAGWVYECVYCTVKTTRCQNRGFLFGPVCPIYGFGFIGAFLLFTSGRLQGTGGHLSLTLVFAICAAGSAVLEYSTSFLLEKLFHARWWDYSHIPLNLNGRICLPATLGFGAAGTVIIGFVLPLIDRHADLLRGWLEPPAEEALSLTLMCLLGVDLGLSISSVTSLLSTLERMGTEFDEVMGTRYEPIGRAQRALAGKISNAGHSVAGMISDAGHTAAGMISDAGHTAAGKISGAGNAVVGRINGAGHAVAGKIGSVGDYQDALRRQVGNLSRRQINALMNIEVFSSIRYTGVAKKMKELLPGQGGKVEAPENGGKTDSLENGGKTGSSENDDEAGKPENGDKIDTMALKDVMDRSNISEGNR